MKIIDTQDVFSRKTEMVLKYGIKDNFACTEEEEREYLLKGGVIMSIQNCESSLFRGITRDRKVITVGVDLLAEEKRRF